MCSIFGLGLQQGHKIKSVDELKSIMTGLLKAGESRGHDAAGLAVTSSKKVVVLKDPITGSELTRSTGFNKLFREDVHLKSSNTVVPTMSILGHCRAQTQGTYRNNDNNHPIVADNVIGVHNGCISNDNFIFKVFPDLKRKAQVDSEAIFRMMSYCLDNDKSMQEAIQATGKQLVGWFACAAVSIKNPYVLWIFRDRTPVELFYYKSVGLTVFATAKNMVQEALKGHSYGTPEEIIIKTHSGVGIDLWSGGIVEFDIDEHYTSVHH